MNGEHVSMALYCGVLYDEDLLAFAIKALEVDFSYIDPLGTGVEL